MSKIILSVILLEALSATVESVTLGCGSTPKIPSAGYGCHNDEYTWMVSLEYKNKDSLGVCSGSVISPWYVLTAAHCVNGELPDRHGGLKGVRLGEWFNCKDGSPYCESHTYFDISKNVTHPDYSSFHNNIALLRLNREIIFTDNLRAICLPSNTPELSDETSLTISGWAKNNTKFVKRAKAVLLWELCMDDDENTICEGNYRKTEIGEVSDKPMAPCEGDSGSPLMYEFEPGRMVLEGIVSHRRGDCFGEFYPSYFTSVRRFLPWIESETRKN